MEWDGSPVLWKLGPAFLLPRTSCRNGIETGDPPATVYDIGAGCFVTLIRPGKVLQPLIQSRLCPAIERVDNMLPGERLDAGQRGATKVMGGQGPKAPEAIGAAGAASWLAYPARQ